MSEFNLEKFIRAYSLNVIDSWVDMLRIIGRDNLDNEMMLATIMRVSKDRHATQAQSGKPTGRSKARVTGPENSYKEDKAKVAKIQIVIGKCPKCGGWVRGQPVGSCSAKKTGRHFYRECESCNYYAEIFKVRNKFREVEGE